MLKKENAEINSAFITYKKRECVMIEKIKHLLITNAKLNELKQLYLKKFFG